MILQAKKREAPEETNLASTTVRNTFLSFEPPSLWYLVMAVLKI